MNDGPCWCDYCHGRAGRHDALAVALYQARVARYRAQQAQFAAVNPCDDCCGHACYCAQAQYETQVRAAAAATWQPVTFSAAFGPPGYVVVAAGVMHFSLEDLVTIARVMRATAIEQHMRQMRAIIAVPPPVLSPDPDWQPPSVKYAPPAEHYWGLAAGPLTAPLARKRLSRATDVLLVIIACLLLAVGIATIVTG